MTTRTVTLTARPPVRIDEDAWPQIAYSAGYSGEHECQANQVWWIRVRQHADGRSIVYGYRDRGNGGMPIDYEGWRGGALLQAGGDIAGAILRVAADGGISSYCADACISALPAEDLL